MRILKEWLKGTFTGQWEGGHVPDWAWYITWGIMIVTMIINFVAVILKLR